MHTRWWIRCGVIAMAALIAGESAPQSGGASRRAAPPLITIAEAIRDSNGDTIPDRIGDRVHVRGVVTIGSGTISAERLQVYFQDQSGGLYLFAMSPGDEPLLPGDVIDVVGILGQYRGAIQVTRPEDEVVSRRAVPPAVPLTPAQAASWTFYGRLITVEGELGPPEQLGPYVGYDLRGANTTLRVMVPPAVSRQIAAKAIPPGSRVSVTGVASIYSMSPPHREGFQIIVGSSSGLRVVERPLPRWVSRAAMFLLALLTAILLLFVARKAWMRRAGLRQREIATLNTLATMAAGASDLESFVADAVGLLTRNGIIDGAVVHLLEGKQLRLHVSHGVGTDKARLVDEQVQSRMGGHAPDRAFSTADASALQQKLEGVYPLVCVPLQGRSRMFGVMTVFAGTRHPLTPAEAGVVASAANLVALGLENVHMLRANDEKQRELEHLAICDPLTGLYNRRFLDEYLRIHMAMARRHNAPVSFIAIDLDDFKRINDTYGHDAGDRVLTQVGDSVRSQTRASDLPVRSGGEEFLVVMPDTSEAGALTFATRLQAELRRQSYDGLPEDVRVTASFGVAVYPDDGESVPALLRAADAALYASKRAGRNRITTGGGQFPPPLEA